MSRASAAALIIVESARRSFNISSGKKILEPELESVCKDPKFQRVVVDSVVKKPGLFSRRSESPTPDDFRSLFEEISSKLNWLNSTNEVRALFLEYEVEDLLYPGDQGVISEGLEEIVFEKLSEKLAGVFE